MTTEVERDLEALAATLRRSSVAVRSDNGRGTGSGVVWSSAGTIITNAHVAQTPRVAIELSDGRRLRGAVERRDEQRDLASVRIDAAGLTPAVSRSAGELRAGELLVAFGHPLGVAHVLTTGIAFGPHRQGGDRFVRADLRLEPGNSGGALADTRGRVVGINSMLAGGLALAIPTDDVQRFLGEADEQQRLGVSLAPASVAGQRGAFAVLATEPGSAAERAGIIPGDIILTRRPAHSRTRRGLKSCAAVARLVWRSNGMLELAPLPRRDSAASDRLDGGVAVRDLADDGAIAAAVAERFDRQATIVTVVDPGGELSRALLAAGARGVIGRDATPDDMDAAIGAVARGFIVLAGRSAAPGAAEPHLTPRERDVLDLLARGLANKQIAARLSLAENTVKFHVASILSKLAATTRTEAAAIGVRRGWVML